MQIFFIFSEFGIEKKALLSGTGEAEIESIFTNKFLNMYFFNIFRSIINLGRAIWRC